MSLPSVPVVRERIENIKQEDIRHCIMATYLFAGRISEVVGRASPSDVGTVARGPIGSDVRTDVYTLGPLKEEAAVFSVQTAKRGGRKRLIALPLKYEPWAKPLRAYFKERTKVLVFPFTRQKVWSYAKDAFDRLKYPIEQYAIYEGEVPKVKKIRKAHTRDFRLHALRHLRATELVEYYGFNAFDLATFCGWTYRTAIGMSSVDRYLSLGWQTYFPKLLKKR